VIDWAEIVDSTIKTPVFPPSEWEHGKGVGTENEAQAIENKRDCKPVPTVTPVPVVFEEARVREDEKHNPSSFEEPAGGGFQGQLAPHKRGCRTCAHLRRPGLSDGHCAGREDLPPAYTPEHPLRRLPADGGEGCTSWLLHWSLDISGRLAFRRGPLRAESP